MAKQNRPSLEMDELTNNLKESSGKVIGVFFPTSPSPKEIINPINNKQRKTSTLKQKQAEETHRNKAITTNNEDMTSSRQDVKTSIYENGEIL